MSGSSTLCSASAARSRLNESSRSGTVGIGQVDPDELIGCLDTPTTGEYWLNGQPVSDRSTTTCAIRQE